MKLKAKNMGVATGGVLVVILNSLDANHLDIHSGDRLRIKNKRNECVAVVDITNSKKTMAPGNIGLFDEVVKKVKVRSGSNVCVFLESKPESILLIKKKINGKRLDKEEIDKIIQDVVKNKLTDVEIAYFVAGSYVNGLNTCETVNLTRAMINTGDVLKINRYPIMDKHCIGGVAGNRTTPIVLPILLSMGYCVPKTSSRSITSPAGTADTVEVMADVTLDMKQIKKVISKVGGCMVWGGAVSLAPADERFIRVGRPVSIDAEGKMISSILAKKGSVSATHVLIDIPVGRGAKVTTMKKAKHLRRVFRKIGKELGMTVKVIITNGSQPIGNGIGPALEARDVLWVLQNDSRAPQDLKNKAVHLSSEIMQMYPLSKRKDSANQVREIIDSGNAYKYLLKLLKAQGARITDAKKIKLAKLSYGYKANRDEIISHLDSLIISRVAKLAGAPADKRAGIYLHKKVGVDVRKKDLILTIYSENELKLKSAVDFLKEQVGVEIN